MSAEEKFDEETNNSNMREQYRRDRVLNPDRFKSAVLSMPNIYRAKELTYESKISKFDTFCVEEKNSENNEQFLMKAIKNEKCISLTLKYLLDQLKCLEHYNLPEIRLTPLPSQTNTSKNYDYSTTGTINNKEWIVKIKEFLGILENDVIADEATNDILTSLKFTKSTYVDEISCKLCTMNVVENSYEYDENTACGFPSITLTGKKDDWLNLREKTITILDKKCDKQFNRQWSESLLPILDRFINVYDGDIDCVFWNSMIKRGAMS